MPKIGDVVLITWEDHFSTGVGWRDKSDLRDPPPAYMCQSAGLIVTQDKGRLTIAQNWTKKRGNDSPKAADYMTIMKPSIKKISTIRKGVW